jgi:small subunit ribosomal protein S8
MHDVSDLATRLRNAIQVKHPEIEIKSTKLLKNMVHILKEEGFIEDFEIRSESPQDFLTIKLKYFGKKQKPSFTHFKPISKPGLRVYLSSKSFPRVLGGLGVAIVSTSQGLLTQKEAEARGIGGEVLCYVW